MSDAFTTLGSSRTDLEAACVDRLSDAQVLLQRGRYASAIAMGLYSVVTCLKARICRKLDLAALPKAFQIHDLDSLLLLTGLRRSMDNLGSHPVKMSWDSITTPGTNQHVNKLRYSSSNNWTQAQATDYMRWVSHPHDGVVP